MVKIYTSQVQWRRLRDLRALCCGVVDHIIRLSAFLLIGDVDHKALLGVELHLPGVRPID